VNVEAAVEPEALFALTHGLVAQQKLIGMPPRTGDQPYKSLRLGLLDVAHQFGRVRRHRNAVFVEKIQKSRSVSDFRAREPHCLPVPGAVYPLALFAGPVRVKLFYNIHNERVDVAASVVEHPAVGDVVGERMLKSILQVGKNLYRVEKLGSLQIVEQTAKPVLG
jgi:hypothetical protein